MVEAPSQEIKERPTEPSASSETEEQPTDQEEQSTEAPVSSEEDTGSSSGSFSMGPEIIMLFLALALDLVNLLLLCVALDDFFIGDIVGIIFIGGWTFARSREVQLTSRAAGTVQKAATQMTKWAKTMKWLRPLSFFLELIPYVGVLPCWTLLVWNELKQPDPGS